MSHISRIIGQLFVGLALLACLVPTRAADSVAPAAKADNTLKLLTWNIQMLTILSGVPDLDKGQAIRAPLIVEYLNDHDFDIVVLQEVIDKKMTAKLKEGLQKQYPYIIAPASKMGIAGASGGNLIASRIPLKYVAHTVYKNVAGPDKLAEKGCLLVEGEKGGVVFQLAGTHLQAGHNAVKEKEFGEIYEGIIKPYQRQGVPQILVGDMNVASDRDEENARFQLLLKTTEMTAFPTDDPKPYTVDAENSWKDSDQTPQKIDHVLLNPRGTKTTLTRQTIQRARQKMDDGVMDLADHYGVIAEIQLLP